MNISLVSALYYIIPFAAVFLARGFHSLLLYADKGDPSSAAFPLDEGLAGAAMHWIVS